MHDKDKIIEEQITKEEKSPRFKHIIPLSLIIDSSRNQEECDPSLDCCGVDICGLDW